MATLRQENKSIYWMWKSIKQRCLNPKCVAYKNYGARGIDVCDEWMKFEPFCEWALNNGWQRGLDIDRIDNDSGYYPNNCHFVSRKENVNNRRITTKLTIDGVEKSVSEWADIAGMECHKTISFWIREHGESYAASRVKEAIETGYKPCDYLRNHHLQPIVCLNDGQKFNLICEAARVLNLNSGNIYRVVHHGGTTGGYSFKALEDFDI